MKYAHEIALKSQASQSIIPTQVILHSLGNANNFESGWGWMVDPGNPLEAHLAIRLDGYRRQAVPYTERADANYTANHRPDGTGAISIETDSSINALEPWTDDQVESIIEVVTNICRTFSIPPRLCRSPDDPGIGWHIMWGTPGAWTPVAKACPGPARIAQVPGIVAHVAANLGQIEVKPAPPQSKPPTDWLDMATEADLRRIVREELKALLDDDQATDEKIANPATGVKQSLGARVRSTQATATRSEAKIDRIAKAVGVK